KPHACARHSDLRQAGANRVLTANEAGTSGRAALLGIIIGEGHAFFGDSVDVGRAIAHHAPAEVADVPDSDVIAPKDEDIWFLGWHSDLRFAKAPDVPDYKNPVGS